MEAAHFIIQHHPIGQTDNMILISGNEMPAIATKLRSWAQLDGLPLTAQ